MTRLQTKGSPCECGKTTKAFQSFVTKTKFYETRSSDRKNRRFFVEQDQKLANGTKYFRKQLYLHKSLTSHPKSPSKERQRILSHESKNVTTENNQKLSKVKSLPNSCIKSALNEMITKDLGMELVEASTGIRSSIDLKDVTHSNDLFSNGNGMVSNSFEKDYQKNELKNGNQSNNKTIHKNGKEKAITELNGFHDSRFEPIVKNSEDDEVYESHETHLNELGVTCNGSKNYILQKERKARKTKFEMLLECASELKICVSNKRSRKQPNNFSPPIIKKGVNLNLDNKFEKNRSNAFTMSGKQRKKSGRKPKYKGPVLHYLDVYIKKKEKQALLISDCNKTPAIDYIGENKSLTVKVKMEPFLNLETAIPKDSKQSNFLTSTSMDKINVDAGIDHIVTSIDSKNMQRTRKKRYDKRFVKKPNKLYSKEFDSGIVSVLGHRSFGSNNELLVLFENGTSNWIQEEIEGTALFDELETFYEHTDQNLSSVHRLSYQLTQQIKCKNLKSESDLYSLTESENEINSDFEDVFVKASNTIEKKSRTPLSLTVIQSKHDLPSLLKNVENENISQQDTWLNTTNVTANTDSTYLTSHDLNGLCNNILSSRHVKLYPYEAVKEIVSKVDDEFVHIYLKCFKHQSEQGSIDNDSLNIKTCETLISILEDCAINEFCNVVVVNGVENFFLCSGVFDKLVNKSATLEGLKYEHDIAIIRYLVQTIKNFNKPIVGVIKRTASGLSASLLSLFDMVFDEKSFTLPKTRIKATKRRFVNRSPRAKRNGSKKHSSANESSTSDLDTVESYHNYVFPRLIGLAQRNYAKIMGEDYTFNPHIEDVIDDIYFCKTLSDPLRNSVKHMKNNSKIPLKPRDQGQLYNSRSDMGYQINSDYSQPSMSRHSSNVSQSEIDDLERQVCHERELTKRYMKELSSFLNELNSQAT